jgi:hypothetical protein
MKQRSSLGDAGAERLMAMFACCTGVVSMTHGVGGMPREKTDYKQRGASL